MSTQSEAILEENLIGQLVSLKNTCIFSEKMVYFSEKKFRKIS